jgi:hypothetical protein
MKILGRIELSKMLMDQPLLQDITVAKGIMSQRKKNNLLILETIKDKWVVNRGITSFQRKSKT